MYFDGPTESMFLVGSPEKPARALNPQFDASAQQFSYQLKTQAFAMPLKGPKRLVIRGGAAPAAPAPAAGDAVLSFAGNDTIITWNGSLVRQLVRLPVPGAADRVREVLNFQDNVFIEQPTGSLHMQAGRVKVVRPSPDGGVEYLEGIGGVDVRMGDQLIRGEKVTVEMTPGPDGKPLKDMITILGNRSRRVPATLIKGGSAARADKFVIDRITNTFMALGGALAVVKREGGDEVKEPKPQAAVDAGGLFSGISLQQGGNLFIQCDGDFVKDGATNVIRVRKNVLIKQPGLQLMADEVELEMDAQAAAPAGEGPVNGELFTADPSRIRCHGNIELIAQNAQWVQCDEMVYDVKSQRSTLSMKDKNNDVRIFMRDEGGGSRVLCVRNSLELDGNSGTFKPGGLMVMLPFYKDAPGPRTPDGSPMRVRTRP
jgi:lipopolysaccharide export system protein LptA